VSVPSRSKANSEGCFHERRFRFRERNVASVELIGAKGRYHQWYRSLPAQKEVSLECRP
jgi:hypothetical protein